MNVLLVPTTGLDFGLIHRLHKSIDYPIKRKVLVFNGPGELKGFNDWEVIRAGDNLGVAASWNLAPKRFPDERCWLILNDDSWFLPGALEYVCQQADSLSGQSDMMLLNGTYQGFVWTRRGVDRFGLFDENFWPAYYEDTDMRFRHLIGNPDVINTLSAGFQHGKPHDGGQNWNGMKDGAGVFNRAYFIKKWGSLERPLWTNPYNDPSLSIRDWQLDQNHRAKITPLWDTFISMPNPSIYT